MQQIIKAEKLPLIGKLMHPVVGEGLVEKRLMFCGREAFPDAETAMVHLRNAHPPEQMAFRRVYWMKKVKGGKASVYYRYRTRAGSDVPVGVTKNNPEAVKILIGNSIRGAWLPCMRFELYEDPRCNDLVDMGRFDQWDLMRDVHAGKLEELALQGITPSGNWDFQHMMWKESCSVCGSAVTVNFHLYDIDSVVCESCGNRPFLAPCIHRRLDYREELGAEHSQQMSLHILRWMAGVHASCREVRKDIHDVGGARVSEVMRKTLVWRATDPAEEGKVRALVETNTNLTFDMFRVACSMVQKALTGETPFMEEHCLAAEFVAKATELIRVRQLATRE